jgi:ribonuclease HII
MLQSHYQTNNIEAGCDEAGRGCLAGPVFAAAVIFPKDYTHPMLNDSKLLTARQRFALRKEIEISAVAWAVEQSDNLYIDQHNILKASVYTMHKAIEKLQVKPGFLIIDGNYFIPYKETGHKCIVKGDSLFLSIAAASILAKTYRDEFMEALHEKFPVYGWNKNKGYPTLFHRKAIQEHGVSPFHRLSFKLAGKQESRLRCKQ